MLILGLNSSLLICSISFVVQCFHTRCQSTCICRSCYLFFAFQIFLSPTTLLESCFPSTLQGGQCYIREGINLIFKFILMANIEEHSFQRQQQFGDCQGQLKSLISVELIDGFNGKWNFNSMEADIGKTWVEISCLIADQRLSMPINISY